MTLKRREGDDRPLKHDPNAGLTWGPMDGEPIRWLPRHGEPFCIVEWLSQGTIKLLAYLPVYTAIAVTLVLLVEIFGVPFVGGGR